MRVRAVSGFGAKGPACFLVETGATRLLLDLGRGPDEDRTPDREGIGRIDAIIVSHGHGDHVGSLDRLGEIGSPPVYATEPVRALSDKPTLAAAIDLPIRGEIGIGGVTVRTGLSGHASGGVWLHLSGKRTLLYSGDLSQESEFYSYDPPPPADFAILDASYGRYDVPLASGVEELKAIARKRPLLLPAPAAGRGLEMAVRLGEEDGPPVSLCPAHRAVAEALLALGDRSTVACHSRPRLEALLGRARTLDESSEPRGVMVAAGASAVSGVAAQLVERWVGRADVTIVFTGHLQAGSPAERACASGKAGFIRWNVHPRLSDFVALAGSLRAEAIMPAFLKDAELPALAAALPGLPIRLSPRLGR